MFSAKSGSDDPCLTWAFLLYKKLGEPPHLGLIFWWTHVLHQRQIVPVQYQNQVVTFKVIILNLSRSEIGEVKTAIGCMDL